MNNCSWSSILWDLMRLRNHVIHLAYINIVVTGLQTAKASFIRGPLIKL